METLTFQPPLLGESQAIDDLRDFIVGVSLQADPVLMTGPVGSGKSLAAGKIHAIGLHADSPCSCFYGEGLSIDELQSCLSKSLAHGGSGAVLIRNADRLRSEVAAWIAKKICTGESLPRWFFSSRENLDSPNWGTAREAGLLSLISRLHREIPPLSERKEDVPVLCRYQVWLHTLPEKFEARWDEFAAQQLPELINLPWSGNVTELIERLADYCQVSKDAPLRWVGDSGFATAQQEFVEKALEVAFQEFMEDLANNSLGGIWCDTFLSDRDGTRR